MRYIIIVSLCAITFFTPDICFSAAVSEQIIGMGPPKLCRQFADNILRIEINPEDIEKTPDIGLSPDIIYNINLGDGILVKRISNEIINIGEQSFLVNSENRISTEGPFSGQSIQEYLRYLISIY